MQYVPVRRTIVGIPFHKPPIVEIIVSSDLLRDLRYVMQTDPTAELRIDPDREPEYDFRTLDTR